MILLKSISRAWIKHLAFAPNGTSLAATASASGLLLWDEVTGGKKTKPLALPVKYMDRLAFTPDGAFLIGADNEVCTVQFATLEAKKHPVLGKHSGFAPTPDSSRVIVCVCRFEPGKPPVRHSCWSLHNPDNPEWEVFDDMSVRFGPFFINGEHYLVIGIHNTKGYCLQTRSAKTGELISEAVNLPISPDYAILSPDAARVASITTRFIHVHSVSGPFHEKPVISNDNRKYFVDLAYHPSGRYLAAASNDETVKFFDTTTWELVRTFTWKTGKMRAVAFSPDGNLVAAGGEKGQVVVWDVDL